MTENSKIEWTDHTFNPWYGCTKISPGCDHCYAEGWSRRSGLVEWGGQRRRTSVEYWQQPFRWNDRAAAAGKRARVFCASLADVFDNTVDPTWRADLFTLIRGTPHLDWLLLTKRIGNARALIERAMRDGGVGEHFRPDVPWQNVWLGATVVNQEEADRDIPKLLATPARIRFLSIEPMLGPINLNATPAPAGTIPLNGATLEDCRGCLPRWQTYPMRAKLRNGIDWVIVGGESGGGARPMHPAWARSLRDQCNAAGVPFLFKQWGEWAPLDVLPDLEGKRRFDVQVNGYTAVRAGKKLAGRMLDGREWDQFPEVAA